MPSIVLNSFQRASIGFNKLAKIEANRLENLNARGEIDAKDDSNSLIFKAEEQRLAREVANLDFEITKANKSLSAFETANNALDQMRVMVDKIKDLENAAAAETNTTLATSYVEQIDELKEQMIQLGEAATYQDINFFKGWGTETANVNGNNFTTTTVDLADVINGFAYRGGNILGIENGDFDTSAYPNLVAAFGPDTINNSYSDFTGNFPDGTLVNGATIAQNGPNGGYGLDFSNPTNARTNAGAPYVQLPAGVELTDEVTLGIWFKQDTAGGTWQRGADFSNGGVGSNQDLFSFGRMGGSQRMRMAIHDDFGNHYALDTVNNVFEWGEWSYFMFTRDSAGNLQIFKDGENEPYTVGGGLTLPMVIDTDHIKADNFLGRDWFGASTGVNGGFSDFVVFDKALDADEAKEWYNNIGMAGLENSFFTMTSDKLEAALDKIESHFIGQSVAVDSVRNQLIFKQELMVDDMSNLVAIDSEEVALQMNIAQTRQTLAITSLNITNQAHNQLLSLFN